MTAPIRLTHYGGGERSWSVENDRLVADGEEVLDLREVRRVSTSTFGGQMTIFRVSLTGERARVDIDVAAHVLRASHMPNCLSFADLVSQVLGRLVVVNPSVVVTKGAKRPYPMLHRLGVTVAVACLAFVAYDMLGRGLDAEGVVAGLLILFVGATLAIGLYRRRLRRDVSLDELQRRFADVRSHKDLRWACD